MSRPAVTGGLVSYALDCLVHVLTDTIGGEEGLRSLCTPKAVIHDRLFSLIRTPIPKLVGKSAHGNSRHPVATGGPQLIW